MPSAHRKQNCTCTDALSLQGYSRARGHASRTALRDSRDAATDEEASSRPARAYVVEKQGSAADRVERREARSLNGAMPRGYAH